MGLTIRWRRPQTIGRNAYLHGVEARRYARDGGGALSAVSLMFSDRRHRMLDSMSEVDPGTDASLVNWSELGVSGLPTGTVTLLLADVEGSTRLWETEPKAMKAGVARLDPTLPEAVATPPERRP